VFGDDLPNTTLAFVRAADEDALARGGAVMAVGVAGSVSRRASVVTVGLLTAAAAGVGVGPGTAGAAIMFRPAVSDVQFVTASETPPTQAQCASVMRRCFAPLAIQNSYNLPPLYAQGLDGRGQTIAIVDSFGSDTIRHDLNVFDTAFGLPHMCGEEGVSCQAGMPTFSVMQQGNVNTTGQPPNNGTGQETHNLWALEVALDVEWAHSVAPRANIILVTTPTAETLGVQGFPDFFKAEDTVIKQHLAGVITQSFASAEDAFASTQSLLNLRYAFVDAQAEGVTMLGSSGDSGTANIVKEPVKDPALIPVPSVEWPASDPLVTGVGGTYLCTDPITGQGVDNTSPPVNCQDQPNREVGWVASGGGFSHVFARPSFQTSLPAGSTPIPPDSRGVPDVAYQASSRTGVLVYITNPGYSGIVCPGGVLCSTGWYVVGGTSSGSPQWAGLVSIANQINGGPLGYLNPALYRIGVDPARYAADFYDVTTGNNQLDPSIPGYSATVGWDPVTGLGTPNAAVFLPDLVAAVHGH
jgi:subtilase family serine protease